MVDKTLIFPLLVIVLLLSQTEAVLMLSQTEALATDSSVPAAYTNFIETKCNITAYPSLCVKTLMPYASSIKTNSTRLLEEALKVAIKGARRASVIVSNLSKEKGISRYEAVAIKACIERVKISANRLKQSVKEIGYINGDEDEYELFNAMSYTSSAIRNTESCIHEFSNSQEQKINPKVKKVIERSMTVLTRLSSVALSLISHP